MSLKARALAAVQDEIEVRAKAILTHDVNIHLGKLFNDADPGFEVVADLIRPGTWGVDEHGENTPGYLVTNGEFHLLVVPSNPDHRSGPFMRVQLAKQNVYHQWVTKGGVITSIHELGRALVMYEP